MTTNPSQCTASSRYRRGWSFAAKKYLCSLIVACVGACVTLPTSFADDRRIAAPLLKQLEDRRYSERQAAFLKLCDPKLDIDVWLDEQAQAVDPYRASLCMWLKRLRSVPGSIEERLIMMSDYQTLASGDLSVVSKYVDNRRIEPLVELLEMLPEDARVELIQYRSAENPFDAVIAAAWRDGCEHVLPRLLNAILPKSPVRVGVNARWREIGMPDSWRLDEPMEVPEVEVAALERDGRIDEALAAAKRHRLSGEYEQMLMRHGRWDQWLGLDPAQLARGATSWLDLQRAILLESLGRHEEAKIYYDLRRNSKSKNTSNQIQLAQLALIVGDEEGWKEPLKKHARDELMGMLFLRNEIGELLDNEGLSSRSVEAVDRWFDENVQNGKPLTKPIRFQSLFKRLGMRELEERIHKRIVTFVSTSEREQQLRLWDGILGEWGRFGMDERRLELLAKLFAEKETERPTSDLLLNQRGVQPAVGDPKMVTLETIFFKNFPNIRSAALPLMEGLRGRLPDATPVAWIAIVEDMHQGRMPSGWTPSDVDAFFRDVVRRSVEDPGRLEPMLVDMADALAVMGSTESALKILQDFSSSHAANLQIAQYAAKLGRVEEAAQLSMQILNAHPDDVNAYLLAIQRLADARQYDDWLMIQRRTLSRMDTWEMVERYFQTSRRTQRAEPQPEILFALEMMCNHRPSTWYEIWFGDAYTQYGSRILTDWYHRSIASHPERADKLATMARVYCLNEIQSFSEEQLSDQGGLGNNARWEIEWSQWCMRYERSVAAGFWQAVQRGDHELADRLIRTAHRLYPEQINTLIDAVASVRTQFDEETLRAWFDVYFQPMKQHLETFPSDSLTANNAAWLAAKCGFELEYAYELSSRVVETNPTDTYMDTLAEVEFVRGNVAKAIEISERCRALQPRDSHHREQLGRFQKALVPEKK